MVTVRRVRPVSRAALTGVAVLAMLASSGAVATADPAGPSGPSAGPSAGTSARPASVVQRALDARSGVAADGPAGDVTLAMRDLAYALPTLHGADRTLAQRLLARPTDPDDPFGGYYGVPESDRCYDDFCLTWVSTGPDAPPSPDANADGVPDWVETTRDAASQVLTAFERAGYRAPLLDGGRPDDGPTTQLDIYLANLGDDSVYGYCVPDVDSHDAVTPGYCVLDNDFSPEEFGSTPLLNLGVTAAHELFHATQFAYDATEAPWFMESTATWMEDELVDTSNDNYQYLPYGPLGIPTMSLDNPDPFGANVYGAWIFWRFMAEQLGNGGSASAIRKVWELAGDGPGEPNLDGLVATRTYVEGQGADWSLFFSAFAAANRLPARYYEEGASYPPAPAQARVTLTPKHPGTGRRSVKLNHLSSRHVLLSSVPAMRGNWSLKVAVNLPDRATGVRAVVTVEFRNGTVRMVPIALDAKGDGAAKYPFQRTKVSRVALTFVNAGTRYQCGTGSDWSCQGTSLDDGRAVAWSATAVRSK